MFGHDVTVGEIGDPVAVGDGAAEPDKVLSVVDPNDTLRLFDESLDFVVRPAERPMGVVGQEVVDGSNIDPTRIVIEFVAVGKRALHLETRSLEGRCTDRC